MAALARSRKRIEAAWRSFVVDGRLPESMRPEIRRSWQRVRTEWQVDPGLRTCPGALGEQDVVERAEAEEAFRFASPVLTEFASRLASDGHVVGYFGADGVMLSLLGNARTRARLAGVNFAPGACWTESAAGTNGIGTALVEARPIEVFASEHFVEAWQPWTCASVPVRFRGQVVGVVDITSPWRAYNPALLLTAESMARTIEAQLEASAAQRESASLIAVAQGALRARDVFLAVASHELKTPLTPLQLDLQRLLRLASSAERPLDAEELVRALRGAEGHVRRLVEFMDDLGDATRIAYQPLHLALEPTDLGALVRDFVQRHRRQLERAGCEVVVTVVREAVGRWDPARVEQALKHLVVNAIKHAPGRIEVEVDLDASSARLLVRDHGPGIPPEDQDRVFLPFERAVSHRNVAGFGLGLHVVREIAEAHGGVVRLESAPGMGTTFVVELPLRRQHLVTSR